MKLLEQREMPFVKVGTHRRIRFSDLMDYKKRRDAERRHGLAELTQLSQELGHKHVLAAAVASRAQVIVTQNLRDFPQASLAPFEVETQTPDEFLTHLFYLAPEYMVTIIKEQASDLCNPPKAVADVLNSLALHAPEFTKLVRKELHI